MNCLSGLCRLSTQDEFEMNWKMKTRSAWIKKRGRSIGSGSKERPKPSREEKMELSWCAYFLPFPKYLERRFGAVAAAVLACVFEMMKTPPPEYTEWVSLPLFPCKYAFNSHPLFVCSCEFIFVVVCCVPYIMFYIWDWTCLCLYQDRPLLQLPDVVE